MVGEQTSEHAIKVMQNKRVWPMSLMAYLVLTWWNSCSQYFLEGEIEEVHVVVYVYVVMEL